MKTLLLTALLLGSLAVYGQDKKNQDSTNTGYIEPLYVSSGTLPVWQILRPSGTVASKSDTTVLYKGLPKCIHVWANKAEPGLRTSCLVYHGPEGCPDEWPNLFRVCSSCLRHENIKVSYTFIPDKNTYEELIKRIPKH